MSTLGYMQRKRSAVLLRTEEDGTQVWRYQGRVHRVAPKGQGSSASAQGGGWYAPFSSRRAMYAGHKDRRPTGWTAEAVREMRQLRKHDYRAVKPGPQTGPC